jgi:hypothetical protein
MKSIMISGALSLVLCVSCSRADSNAASNDSTNKVTGSAQPISAVPQRTNVVVGANEGKSPAFYSIPAVRSQGEGGDHTRALMMVDSNGQPMVSGSKAGAGFQYDISTSLNSAFGGSMVPSYWCLEAEQVFEGRFEAGPGLLFDSDKDYRLTFKLLKDKGLVYMCGRGTVTAPDSKPTRLGYNDTIGTWLPLLASKDALQREAASQALGDLAKTAQEKDMVVPKLIGALDDDTFQVRRSAGEALGKLGDKRAIQALTARSDDKGEKDAWVRKVVLEALDKINK